MAAFFTIPIWLGLSHWRSTCWIARSETFSQDPGQGYKATLDKARAWSTAVRGAPKAHDDYRARQEAANIAVKSAPGWNETRFWSGKGTVSLWWRA